MKKMVAVCALAFAAVFAYAAAEVKPPAKAEAESAVKNFPADLKKSGGFGGTMIRFANDELTAMPTAKSSAWSGWNTAIPKFKGNPNTYPGWGRGTLVFEAKALDDKKLVGEIQVGFAYRDPKGKLWGSSQYVQIMKYVPGKKVIAHEFKTVKIPLNLFKWTPNDKHDITRIAFQFCGCGNTSEALILRNLHFEFPEK